MDEVLQRIDQQVKNNPVVLYMKGTPQFPQCGFSSRTVQALAATGVRFAYVNVLEDPEIRQHLPRYADWPTFPQLFVGGELVGGCDIALQLYESGDLQKMAEQAVDGAESGAE